MDGTILTLAKVGKLVVAPVLKDFFRRLPRLNDEAFAKARQETFEDWTIELARLLQERFDYLNSRVEGLEETVAVRATDLACIRVAANYARAADSEPTDERRRDTTSLARVSTRAGVSAAAAVVVVELLVDAHAIADGPWTSARSTPAYRSRLRTWEFGPPLAH